MQIPRSENKGCGPDMIRVTLFHNWPKTVYPLFAALSLILLFSIPAAAAVDGLLAKCDDGGYHQYDYEDLLDSYALKIIGKPDGLYADFAEIKLTALYTSENRYIDYDHVLDQYALVLSNGGSFDLNQYLTSGEALVVERPDQIKAVSLTSGKVVREVINSGESGKTEDPNRESGSSEPEDNPAGEPKDDKYCAETVIVASAKVSISDALQWAKEKRANQRFIDIAPLYWKYAEKTGIRPEVLYAQSALETGFGRFHGQVPAEYNNWAGIKTADADGNEPEDHEKFADAEDGVRAHFNHISAYVGLPPTGEPHGRYHLVARLSWAGTVKTLEDLSGKWAPSPTYHVRIIAMLEEMEK